MKNYNLKSSIYILVIVSGISLFVLLLCKGIKTIEAISFLMLIPKVVTIDLFVIFIFSKWLWKLRIFRGWLVPFENLNGTWIGEIRSSWIDKDTSERIAPIPAMLTIKQSFFSISCKMFTSEMNSTSYVEDFVISLERQVKQLTFSYTSNPNVLLDSRNLPHNGSVIFDIIINPSHKLEGKYWTDRKTNGKLEFTYYSKDMLEVLPNCLGEHPMNNR